jgi:hypothetical protein
MTILFRQMISRLSFLSWFVIKLLFPAQFTAVVFVSLIAFGPAVVGLPVQRRDCSSSVVTIQSRWSGLTSSRCT